ncbi:energy transducer TonB [Caulobacter radicis]|uniref:energy transducer TonB n=1 Tax=Caulobacter radicis TaxID=2172650 RepID=UPI00140349A7|nr:TonB family protein [Caulobacter radicis]
MADDGGRQPREPKAPWALALGVVGLAHLALIAAAAYQSLGESGPAPGTGAKTFDVVMLPSWPQPGETRKASLGNRPGGSSDGHAAMAAQTTLATRAPLDLKAPTVASSVDDARIAIDTTPNVPAAQARGATAVIDIAPNTPSAAASIWEGEVIAKLASVTRYPAKARFDKLQDTVMVRLTLDRGGRVLAARILQSRGYAILDNEAQALVKRASPLPAPPSDMAGETIELIAPINFVLRRS